MRSVSSILIIARDHNTKNRYGASFKLEEEMSIGAAPRSRGVRRADYGVTMVGKQPTSPKEIRIHKKTKDKGGKLRRPLIATASVESYLRSFNIRLFCALHF